MEVQPCDTCCTTESAEHDAGVLRRERLAARPAREDEVVPPRRSSLLTPPGDLLMLATQRFGGELAEDD
jgi:hypothetical protein